MVGKTLSKNIKKAFIDAMLTRPAIFIVHDHLGIARNTVAEVLGVGGAVVSLWATGRSVIPPERFFQIIEITNSALSSAQAMVADAAASEDLVRRAAGTAYAKRVREAARLLKEIRNGKIA